MAQELFHYIAENNTPAAEAVAGFYNYGYDTHEELAECLQEIVLYGDDEAYQNVMKAHPDREIILDLHTPAQNARAASNPQDRMITHPESANGETSTSAATGLPQNNLAAMLHMQTNTTLIIGIAVLVCIAIYIKK